MTVHLRKLVPLALPLILANTTITAMQLVDALVLARHSADSVAAMGPASMAVILIQSLVFGTTGYTSVFCSHAFGAGDSVGVRRNAWLGLHLAWMIGLALLLLAWPLGLGFFHVGHPLAVAKDAAIYFRWMVAGSLLVGVMSALGGWLSGIGRTKALTAVHVVGFAINAALAWMLVLGKLGCPALGMLGAALATLAAQGFTAIALFVLFVRSGGWSAAARRIDATALGHFLSLAVPQGAKVAVEILAWTAFLFYIGRLGVVPLAASSIAFRINGLAFFPLLGLGQATGILIGQARGAGKDEEVPAIAWQSLLLGEGWMLIFVALFLTIPGTLFTLFTGTDTSPINVMGAGLLGYIAVYSIFDAANVILGCSLAATGDTSWNLRLFLISTAIFLACMHLLDRLAPSLSHSWLLATLFVLATAIAWVLRFQGGKWKECQVLEENIDRP
jgi:multidrug resistance protein, MATE family